MITAVTVGAVATPEAAAASWYMLRSGVLRFRVYTYVYTAIRYPRTRIIQ